MIKLTYQNNFPTETIFWANPLHIVAIYPTDKGSCFVELSTNIDGENIAHVKESDEQILRMILEASS